MSESVYLLDPVFLTVDGAVGRGEGAACHLAALTLSCTVFLVFRASVLLAESQDNQQKVVRKEGNVN